MAKTAKKTTKKSAAKSTTAATGKAAGKKTSKKSSARRYPPPPDATGKNLVIVESPTKAKTINKYLGPDYVVMASVGHVRDLPNRAPKGQKQPVPGVDLEHDFKPTYEVLPDKKKTVTDLKKAAKSAADVWFATDLDREGEAIAWHLAESLGVDATQAKRVVFNAITKGEIENAFKKPRPIDGSRVNAQQARRILDRIVGYQISPLLWKKVAGGLSAGRVQSVAARLVVEREREIEAFIPDEYWKISGYFATDVAQTQTLTEAWRKWLDDAPEDKPRLQRERFAWLSEHSCLLAELVDVDGKAFKPEVRDEAMAAAKRLGFAITKENSWEDPKAKGPAKYRIEYVGHVDADAAPAFKIDSIQTRRTTTKPPAPFITSTLQQAASNRLGFPLQRTMRIAQQLYEGIDLKGSLGQTGLITYMRTDSTHLSGEALQMARDFIKDRYGDNYLPDKPNFYSSSNKAAQEAHEAIRPTDVRLSPDKVKQALSEEQFRLYSLIWQRFTACQMLPAQWDSTTVMITTDPKGLTFKATGRILVFDGFYRAAGVPQSGDALQLPPLKENQPLGPIQLDPTQHFTSPPARYTEASLQKKLEEEGIGRPSTYAAIIQTIQTRKYAEQMAPRDRRLRATDLGKVVTDKLIEGFPNIMDVAYTRKMEEELDKVESDHHDWVAMLHDFYGPFRTSLDNAMESMTHAKAETEPAPFECEKCGAGTMYRFGKNGRFLSCTRYPDCDYAAPIDRDGNPLKAEVSDIACPECNSEMTRRVGRFGPFLGCANYPECKGIVKLDAKKHGVVLPKAPPLLTDLPCPKCESPLNLRRSKRGPWLSCSAFPKCRGRESWAKLEEDVQQKLEAALEQHEKDNPVPDVKTRSGEIVQEGYLPQIEGAPPEAEPGPDEAVDSDAA